MLQYRYFPQEENVLPHTINKRLVAIIDLHPLDTQRFCLCRHKGFELWINAYEYDFGRCDVYMTIRDDDDYDKSFLKECNSKEEIIQVFRHAINEAVDISRGQVFIEDVISVFGEMGFEIY